MGQSTAGHKHKYHLFQTCRRNRLGKSAGAWLLELCNLNVLWRVLRLHRGLQRRCSGGGALRGTPICTLQVFTAARLRCGGRCGSHARAGCVAVGDWGPRCRSRGAFGRIGSPGARNVLSHGGALSRLQPCVAHGGRAGQFGQLRKPARQINTGPTVRGVLLEEGHLVFREPWGLRIGGALRNFSWGLHCHGRQALWSAMTTRCRSTLWASAAEAMHLRQMLLGKRQ